MGSVDASGTRVATCTLPPRRYAPAREVLQPSRAVVSAAAHPAACTDIGCDEVLGGSHVPPSAPHVRAGWRRLRSCASRPENDADPAGRLTKKTTAIRNANAAGSDPLQQTVDQIYTYNDLSLPAQITYPGNCTPIPCGENAAWNTIAPGYSAGQLHNVPAFATSVAYGPSGAVQTVQHANGVLDTIAPDANGLARPASISFTGTAPCSVPAINSAPDQTVPYGTAATLTVSASGTTLSYQWHNGGASPTEANKIPGATGSTYTTLPITNVTTWWIVVFNSCGNTQRLVTVTPTLSPPSNLSATATTTTQVSITWNPQGNADHYELERRSNGGAFARIATPAATSYAEIVSANTTYVYRVRSANANASVVSGYSNNDLATTITFSPVVAGATTIQSAHFDELLSAMNLVRAANGASSLTWTAILPAGIPAPAPGVVVYRDHLTSLRAQMDAARQALGIATSGYTDPVVDTTVPIRALHILELRSATQ